MATKVTGSSAELPDEAATMVRRSRLRRLRETWPPLVVVALVWVLTMALVSVFADALAPTTINATDLRNRLMPPVLFGGDWAHPLGTDELGRDMLSRLIFSIRMSIAIAFVASLISATIGITVGLIAAHFRGLVEDALMMLTDISSSIPFIIIALAMLAFFGSNLLLFICLMGFAGWERYSRLVRGLTISANEQGYARAIRQLGASPYRVYLLHILPNIGGTLLVTLTLSFPEIILLETGMSFLGLGVQPPKSSLGNMIGFGRDYLYTAPWILFAPAAVVVFTTLSISVLGDWLRDIMDASVK